MDLDMVRIADQFGLSSAAFDSKYKVRLNGDVLVNCCLLDAQSSLLLVFQNHSLFVNHNLDRPVTALVLARTFVQVVTPTILLIQHIDLQLQH